MRNKYFILPLLLLVSLTARSQDMDLNDKKYFVGSTFFMALNLVDDPEPPNYYQLNFGYRITPKDVITMEFINWNYYEPLGVPNGKKKKAPNFPGKVHAYGAGLTYKRFLWKRVYAQVHSTALKQQYLDKNNKEIQKGFQLFNTLRVGYQFRFFNNRIFLEPSVACTFWPINTNLPQSFKILEDMYPSYFIGEPGLHFGFNF